MLVPIASGKVKAPCGHHRDRHPRLQLLLAVRTLRGDALVDRPFPRVHFLNFS